MQYFCVRLKLINYYLELKFMFRIKEFETVASVRSREVPIDRFLRGIAASLPS